MPAFLIFVFMGMSFVFLPILLAERMNKLSCFVIFCCIFLFGWWGISMQYPKEIKKETIYPIQEIASDKGKIQMIIKNDEVLSLSYYFKYYLDAEKFDVKVIEYETFYAGLAYLISDSYEVVEKK